MSGAAMFLIAIVATAILSAIFGFSAGIVLGVGAVFFVTYAAVGEP